MPYFIFSSRSVPNFKTRFLIFDQKQELMKSLSTFSEYTMDAFSSCCCIHSQASASKQVLKTKFWEIFENLFFSFVNMSTLFMEDFLTMTLEAKKDLKESRGI